MDKALLTINAGSSSIKFTLFKTNSSSELIEDATGQIDGIPDSPHFKVLGCNGEILVDTQLVHTNKYDHKHCLEIICSWITQNANNKNSIIGIGHRVVHGGLKYSKPVLVNSQVLDELAQLIPLAPLHQPHNLQAIRAFQKILPDVPQIACFDTAFHHTQPDVAQKFALPIHFFYEGIRRYGFHGLSYEYIASVLPRFAPELTYSKIVVAHLGNGASLCAIKNSRSMATTMGFSPLDGLVMGTRCGNLDPGVILYLMDQFKMDVRAIEHMLYYESGLIGLSNISNDMRHLLASHQSTAKEAVELFVYRVAREIGSLAVALGGLDGLVFTGGIGENSAEIRSSVCQQISWLDLELSQEANQASLSLISKASSKIVVCVVKTNENLMIALHTKRLLVK